MSAPSPERDRTGPTRPSRVRTRFVAVDGLRIRISECGGVAASGPPLLLVMGLGGNLDMWCPLQERLAERGVRTIAFDAPGSGESERWRLPQRLPAVAQLTVHLLDELGEDVVDVLGVSLGGAIAQQLGHSSPDRVRRLVLAATACGVGGIPGDPRALLVLATPRRYRDPDYFRRVAGRVFGGRARQDPHYPPGGTTARFARPPSWAGYLGQLYSISGWSSLPWLRTLRQPTLVLTGDDDPIVPVVNARLLARLVPDASLRVIRGGGHLFLLEEADLSAALVADFVGR